ncbi:hypothetical protein WD019_02295 [Fictibacillus sp. Mic-4]|uniref:hypothetical protein n=1 Tax=Fictibacillus sp. Mic-4 TaxID=3132826 RepID=UPI003CF6E0D2
MKLKHSRNIIPDSRKSKRLIELDRINPYAAYNGGFQADEDPADYYTKALPKGVRLA